MADRVRDKRSGSKLHISKGSVNHIGATPYRFRIDIFVSYVDNVKNATEVCVCWERRGNVEATNVVKVKEKKAVFRQSLSMESTLFRRTGGAKGAASSAEPEELKFDEKRAKFVLRKGGPDGKAVGKIALNLADYVRGTTSTVFADMKLSNGSVIVTKIEATMLQVGKKKKNGSQTGSEGYSEMTDMNSMENDSIFGDDDRDLGDVEIPTTPTPDDDDTSSELQTPPVKRQGESGFISPVSSAASSSTNSLAQKGSVAEREESRREPKRDSKRASQGESRREGVKENVQSPARASGRLSKIASKGAALRVKQEDDLQESPSLRDRIKGKMKRKDKDKEGDKDDAGEEKLERSSSRSRRKEALREQAAEITALKKQIESLKKENDKLLKAKQAAMEEVDALRGDLEACEAALEDANNEDAGGLAHANLEMSKTLKEKNKRIAELEAQNENLLEELEELHEGAVESAVGVASGQMKVLKARIEELEIALKREPQYMDVVNELKVTKVSLALANMEKEQALFALQTASQQMGQ